MLELNFTPFPGLLTERLALRRITNEDAEEESDKKVLKCIDRPRQVQLMKQFLDKYDRRGHNE